MLMRLIKQHARNYGEAICNSRYSNLDANRSDCSALRRGCFFLSKEPAIGAGQNAVK